MPREETIEENVRTVQRAYVTGRIDAEEMERGLAHVLAGGMGTAEFPYLPVFEAFQTETYLL